MPATSMETERDSECIEYVHLLKTNGTVVVQRRVCDPHESQRLRQDGYSLAGEVLQLFLPPTASC